MYGARCMPGCPGVHTHHASDPPAEGVVWSSEDAQRASTPTTDRANQGVQYIKGVHNLPNDLRLPTTVMLKIPRR
eukprot:6749450-Pyramimonas_sp.AAC.1